MESIQKAVEQDVSFEDIKKLAVELMFTFQKPEFYIDKGGVGTVYDMQNGYCIKILDDRHTSPNREMFDLGNHPEMEAMLQEKMSSASYTGETKVPKYFGIVSSGVEGGRNALIMERLHATNLQHVLNGTEKFPETFELDSFFDELGHFLEFMHTTEEIAHNDLYARNIMIDIETGKPRVIDFGRSVDLALVPDPELRKRYINNDWDNYDALYTQLVDSLQR